MVDRVQLPSCIVFGLFHLSTSFLGSFFVCSFVYLFVFLFCFVDEAQIQKVLIDESNQIAYLLLHMLHH